MKRRPRTGPGRSVGLGVLGLGRSLGTDSSCALAGEGVAELETSARRVTCSTMRRLDWCISRDVHFRGDVSGA